MLVLGRVMQDGFMKLCHVMSGDLRNIHSFPHIVFLVTSLKSFLDAFVHFTTQGTTASTFAGISKWTHLNPARMDPPHYLRHLERYGYWISYTLDSKVFCTKAPREKEALFTCSNDLNITLLVYTFKLSPCFQKVLDWST